MISYLYAAFIAVGTLVIGILLGIWIRKRAAKRAEEKISNADEEALRIVNEAIKSAENKKREVMLEAKEDILRSRNEYEKEVKERRAEQQKQERRLQQKEENLDRKTDALEKREEALNQKHAALDKENEEIKIIKRSQTEMLERISGFTAEDAKKYLIEQVESEVTHETALKIKEIETNLKDNADQLAREIISIAIQTLATVYALRLVRATKYNSVWILFIVGFSLLSVERLIQFLVANGQYVPRWWFAYLGIVVSVCLSIGVMYAHKLFKYIDRLNRQRSLLNKRILTAVLRTEEKARSRFSKELHDGLGPLLSSARMSLSALAREERDAEQREIIDNTTYVIDEAIRSLREISNNLSPHVLNDFGLARGVQNFIDKSAAMHDVKIRFTTNLRSERFDTDIEVILYRVICELINNSLKHAACSSINLSLSLSGTCLALDYTDDGRGFNPEAMMDCGMGLSNISSRINSLGGSFAITSSKGKGMRATIRVSTQEEQPQQKRIRR